MNFSKRCKLIEWTLVIGALITCIVAYYLHEDNSDLVLLIPATLLGAKIVGWIIKPLIQKNE